MAKRVVKRDPKPEMRRVDEQLNSQPKSGSEEKPEGTADPDARA
jgi:hypothetical protein